MQLVVTYKEAQALEVISICNSDISKMTRTRASGATGLWLGRGSPTSQATEHRGDTILSGSNQPSINVLKSTHASWHQIREHDIGAYIRSVLYKAMKIHEYLGSQTDGGD